MCLLHPKDLKFEHGGAKLAYCPWRHLTSLRPWCQWPRGCESQPDDLGWLASACRPKSLVKFDALLYDSQYSAPVLRFLNPDPDMTPKLFQIW